MAVARWPYADERELELLRAVLASDRWGAYHPFVPEFEAKFAEFQHCRHGLAAANGTLTLEIAFESLDLQPGDEIIVPAISFVSSATAVNRAGGIPVFVDIDYHTFNVDPERVRAALSPRTRAILAVHFGGPMANMDALQTLADTHGVPLIEDAAHAHGSEWRGRRAGSLGLAGSFSFQNSKVMTAGEGGILTSNDGAFLARCRSVVDQGRIEGGGWFHHYSIGTNYRMTALQAAVLLAQLERLPEQNCRRMRNARLLREELAGVEELALQRVPPEAAVHTNYLFLGHTPRRDAFQKAVIAAGVPCTAFYPHTLYRNPAYDGRNCRVEPCPEAERSILDAFWLPHRALLGSEEETLAIARILREAARS